MPSSAVIIAVLFGCLVIAYVAIGVLWTKLTGYERNVRSIPEFQRVSRQLFITRNSLDYIANMHSEFDNDHYVLVYRDTLRERIKQIDRAMMGCDEAKQSE